MISHVGRTVVRLHPSSSCLVKFHVDSIVQRVSTTHYTQLSQPSSFLPFNRISCREYATKPVSRPKAHTGRTTSTRTRKPKTTETTTKTATSAKRKPAGTKSTKAKTAPKKKAKKAKKVKKAAKSKAKPKRTTRKKKPLTEEQTAAAAEKKKRQLIRTLKVDALKPPKALPATAFQVLVAETTGQTGSGVELLKEKVAKYKQLAPEQLEHYNHIANENKKKNEEAYRKWVLSHSVEDIEKAHRARNGLKRLGVVKKPMHIKDDRHVARPPSAWALYMQERVLSGDYKLMKGSERTKLIASEYKDLPAAGKKVFEDRATKRKEEYLASKAAQKS